MSKIATATAGLALAMFWSCHGVAGDDVFQTVFTGNTWPEAVSKLPCRKLTKDDFGWTVYATLIVKGEKFVNPAVLDKESVGVLNKKCPVTIHLNDGQR